jgi:A/G-specific adenine glycosylase
MHSLRHESFLLENKLKIQLKLLEWYSGNGFEFEWRSNHSNQQQQAYRVWVSEVMLQQTRVETVASYYSKWMTQWPTLKDLAMASEEDVHTIWSGLGYYSRASRLLQASKLVVDSLNGLVPSLPEDLIKLPGIGRYTAGAIASISFNQPVPLVDGNVIRVLCRLAAFRGSPKLAKNGELLWTWAGILVDPNRPGDFNQALMDLGREVCTVTNPKCKLCPLESHCLVRKLQVEGSEKDANEKLIYWQSVFADLSKDDGPIKKKKKLSKNGAEECCPEPSLDDVEDLYLPSSYPLKVAKKVPRKEICHCCIVRSNNLFYVEKNPPKGLLANLFDLPHIILKDNELDTQYMNDALSSRLLQIFPTLPIQEIERLDSSVLHKFSHIHRTIHVFIIDLDIEVAGKWISFEDVTESRVPVPTSLKKIIIKLQNFLILKL